MSEMRLLIEDTAQRIFQDLCTKEVVDEAEKGEWPSAVWNALEESGLTHASVPEDLGGSGGELGDALAVLKHAGAYAAPIPIAETFLAGWLLAESGISVPAGALTVAIAHNNEITLTPGSDGGYLVNGTAGRVAFGSRAAGVVVVVSEGEGVRVALVGPAQCEIEQNQNLAGESCDAVTFSDVALSADVVKALDSPLNLDAVRRMGALCRVLQMSGAMETILRLCVEHANVRVQFGRPIGSFQAVRQQLAVLGGQVAAAQRAADVAAAAVEVGGGETEVAVAKARVGEAAGIVAGIAHQVHGAIGITHEHALHQYTRRLWAWRDDFGSERDWEQALGREVARRGADGLWAFITEI